MKVSNLLFAKYNNYPNRLVKTVLTDFASVKTDYSYLEVDDVNFHQGNGIAAEQVINADFEAFDFDYLFICDADDSYENVTSRWFVIGKEDLRRGQVRVSLKRDLASDFFDDVTSAKFMMNRGNLDFGEFGDGVNRATDPLVFLPEEQKYNQIKKAEYKLYRFGNDFSDPDFHEPAWIVGYVPKNLSGYYSVVIQELGTGGLTYGTVWGMDFNEYTIQKNRSDAFDVIAMPYADVTFHYSVGNKNFVQKKDVSMAIMTALAAQGIVYDLQIVPYLPGFRNDHASMDWTAGGMIELSAQVYNWTSAKENHANVMEFGVYKGVYPGNIQAEHTDSSVTAKFPQDWPGSGSLVEVVFVSDTGANKVAAGNDLWKHVYALKDGCFVFTSGTDYNLSGTTITFTNPIEANGLFKMMDAGEAHLEIVYKAGTDPNNIQPMIVSLAYSAEDFELQIDPNGDIDTDVDLDDVKLLSNTQLFRLVSPNQDGLFEWSPAMNYTIRRKNAPAPYVYKRVCGWNDYTVSVCLKPFSPYIRVSPKFEQTDSVYTVQVDTGFYGKDFHDARGLICGGDFSITVPSSAWQNYQLQNKTYASTFSRGISSMEKSANWGLASDIVGAVSKTTVGAVAGAKMGGIVGGVIGGVTGAAKGTFDAVRNSVLRWDAIDKEKSDFNMNIQSIMARPDTLVKVSALDTDFKGWPYLEVYQSTNEEAALFVKKMRMTGMLANKMTTIADQMAGTIVYPFQGNDGEWYQFFSGTIAYPGETDMTAEMVEEINRELQAGLYFSVLNF